MIIEIKSYDDFRKMSFSDFFYALRANDGKDAEASSRRIMAAIDPGFVPKILERRKTVILLQAIRKAVADRREEHLRTVRMKEEEEEEERKKYERLGAISGMYGFSFGASLEQVRKLKELQDKKIFDPVDTVRIKIKHLGFEELLDLMMDDYLNESFTHINALTTDEDRCGSFLASLDEKIQQQVTMDENKVLKGLYMLPLLEDDQDLIIYFGTTFHAAFENIDAYTGLLYASTYFDTEESYLKEAFSWTSEDEKTRVIQEARNNRDLSRALKLLDDGAYDEALLAFKALGDFKNSRAMMEKALYARDMALKEESYRRASKFLEEEKYDEARALFEELGDYRDSREMGEKVTQLRLSSLYEKGCQCLQSCQYKEAECFFSQIDGYRDTAQLKDKAHKLAKLEQSYERSYESAKKLLEQGDYERAAKAFAALADYGKQGYKDSRERAEKCLAAHRKQQEEKYKVAERLMSSGKYKAAEAAFNKMSGYLDASERAKQAAVLWSAAQALAAGNVETMRKILNNPVISCLSATKQMEGDLQVLEESIKQELDSGVELEKLKQERSIVYKRCANLREHAATPVPSQIERDESADAAAQIRQALGQLGMFDFKARRDLSEQLQKEIARHNACIQRIPVEIEERKKEVEKEKEGLETREAVLEKQIALQNRLIEDARSRLSELKRKYSCADHD